MLAKYVKETEYIAFRWEQKEVKLKQSNKNRQGERRT